MLQLIISTLLLGLSLGLLVVYLVQGEEKFKKINFFTILFVILALSNFIVNITS